MKNFTNGSLVFRLWQFDGSGEILAKFQYYGDAKDFAKARAEDDAKTRPNHASDYFYLAVCDYENETQAYFPVKPQSVASGEGASS